jgi:hypothetical protein
MKQRLKKITVNVPTEALDNATRITGKGITPTIVAGLHELARRAKRSALRQLKGKVRFAPIRFHSSPPIRTSHACDAWVSA